MANWHFIFAYDHRATEWLTQQGCPHPAARPGNRLPSYEEVLQAWRHLELPPDAPLLIDGIDRLRSPEDSFKIRGNLVLELRLLRLLCERCGQLWVYPDTGSPPIVVDASISPEEVATAWFESDNAENSWIAFHQRRYGG